MCCCILIFTEFFHEMAAKKCNKKWEDGEIEKLIDLYEENSCLFYGTFLIKATKNPKTRPDNIPSKETKPS